MSNVDRREAEQLARQLAREWSPNDVVPDDAPVWDAGEYACGGCHTCDEWEPAVGVLVTRGEWRVPIRIPVGKQWYKDFDDLEDVDPSPEVVEYERAWNAHLKAEEDARRKAAEAEQRREREAAAKRRLDESNAEARKVFAAFPPNSATTWEKAGERMQLAYRCAADAIREAQEAEVGRSIRGVTPMPLSEMKQWAMNQ